MSLAEQACFLQSDCSNNIGGLHNNDRLLTKVLAPDAVFAAGAPSCGALGDLAPGDTVSSTVTLGGGAEGCYDRVILTPSMISTGTLVTSGTDAGSVLTLPNGCSGNLTVDFMALTSSTSFISSGDSSWVLVRAFDVRGDPTLCFGSSSSPVHCADAFAAQNSPL